LIKTQPVADRSSIVSIANSTRAAELSIRYIVGSDPASHEYRNGQRERILQLAARGDLTVPVARSFPLAWRNGPSRCCGPATRGAESHSCRSDSTQ
jgi:NADPH:quinone reductase